MMPNLGLLVETPIEICERGSISYTRSVSYRPWVTRLCLTVSMLSSYIGINTRYLNCHVKSTPISSADGRMANRRVNSGRQREKTRGPGRKAEIPGILSN